MTDHMYNQIYEILGDDGDDFPPKSGYNFCLPPEPKFKKKHVTPGWVPKYPSWVNPVWVRANKTKIALKKMTSDHINNCINLLIENCKDEGSVSAWLAVFRSELARRNI